jgi:BMFP domain-containing protein YqiC
MDHADDGDDVFVYMGGDQRVPRDVTHIRVHKSVKTIRQSAFRNCGNLVSIEMHDGVEIIEKYAFGNCFSLRRIKLAGVRGIEDGAFSCCTELADVEFGDKLKTIGNNSFQFTSLRNIKLPKVRTIKCYAFYKCEQLTDVEMSDKLRRIKSYAFFTCPRLRRIAMPLKDEMMEYNVFADCDNLSQVDLVGGIHKTVSSLLLDSWRNEMKDEINQISQDLPNTLANEKTEAIQDWLERVLLRIDHYKREHYKLLKQFTTLLELALWKAKLDEMVHVKDNIEIHAANTVKNDDNSARRQLRITSGADIVIKNVLPFLVLE